MNSNVTEWLSIMQNRMSSTLFARPVSGIRFGTVEFRMPLYNDIGKKSQDLFSNGFYFGVLCLDLKTKSHDNVELSTSWTKNVEENILYGTIEAKYHLAQYNLALREKLNKNCFLNSEVSYKSKMLRGLTLSLGGSFSPAIGLKSGLLKTEWSSPYCSATSEIEIGKNLSFITSSVVVGCRSAFAGLQWKYDVLNDRQVDFHFISGYATDDFRVHTCMNIRSECGVFIYHRIATELEIGVDVKWWSKSREPYYGVAGRYVLDNDVSVRGKISNNNEMGLSYEQKLSDGVTLTVSTLFNTMNVVGKHKFGLGLRLEL